MSNLIINFCNIFLDCLGGICLGILLFGSMDNFVSGIYF